ncbi:hypothetical protein [Pseudomonas vancouverensis]|uniref:Uncharacterized protein n=1 Tax=Pseudomonas vancouverensis TaxID=95300 RepID=A0A1H2N588_PSEVA|nr:hypothetical protein [Pseudomonas vancouverensis]KAB0495874.1 hypothetical protein F7R09_15155 [Pseudomonas vancouverensis]TDB65676.1 hypothetical protein EIY72_09215 [Pseudomonas vancouverensis]SDV00408.1 hypothetical protein SAMN05216558_1712 [Pseudomonas vancouverensis]
MHLRDLVYQYPQQAAHGVPDWMLGFYKRHSISFADGLTDTRTHVCWFQSRNFSIDLRLPLEQDQVPAKPLAQCSAEELQRLANYEGWEALSAWRDETLSWHGETSLQLHNRWPEPAVLKRMGNCMIEFAPSGAYVEDWRLQVSAPGPLIGLRLLHEKELKSGQVHHRGGGLILCGDYAAMVLGRAQALETEPTGLMLRDLVVRHAGDRQWLDRAFNFETSVATGSLDQGFTVTLSTCAARVGKPLIALDGFELQPDGRHVRQLLQVDGVEFERLFVIDTLEPEPSFAQATGFTADAAQWHAREAPTLSRYTQSLV